MSKKKTDRQPLPPKPSGFEAPPCPVCRSDDTIVTTTRRRGAKLTTRYCKCRHCGETFCKTGPPQKRIDLTEKPAEASGDGAGKIQENQ